jgi:hypothetical protein
MLIDVYEFDEEKWSYSIWFCSDSGIDGDWLASPFEGSPG